MGVIIRTLREPVTGLFQQFYKINLKRRRYGYSSNPHGILYVLKEKSAMFS